MTVLADQHEKRRLKVLKTTSATQLTAWETCERYWFQETVEGLRKGDDDPDKPAHLVRGSHIDRVVEHALRTGEVLSETVTVRLPQDDGTVRVRTEDWTEHVREVLKHLPKGDLHLQMWGRTETYEGGPALVVKPDVLHEPSDGVLVIDDLKTTSDFKYCKSAEELAANVQLLGYAGWGYRELDARQVLIGHAYLRTKWDYKKNQPAPPRAHASLKPHAPRPGIRGHEPCTCAECKSWMEDANRGRSVPPRRVEVPRAAVDAFWSDRLVPTVRKMTEAARSAHGALELEPNTAACADIYGRACPHQERCGLNLTKFGGYDMENAPANDTQGMTLSQRLAAARAATQTTQTQSPKETVPAPTPSVKADAPPGDKGVDGYEPGQGCNGRGFYASKNGQGFAPVEAGHACGEKCAKISIQEKGEVKQVIVTATVAEEASQILPPEVRHLRESTPEEIADAEAAAGKKRGRKKAAEKQQAISVSVTCQFCEGSFPADKIDAHREKVHAAELAAEREAQERAEAERKAREDDAARKAHEDATTRHAEVQPDLGVGTLLVQSPGSTAEWVAADGKLDARVADDRRAAARARLEETVAQVRPADRKRPPEPPTLYVDCAPRRGEPATPADEWLAPIMELAAAANVDRDGKSSPVEDFRLIPYTADGVLAVAIRACLDSCPRRLALRSESRAHRVALEVLTPWAAEVVE